MTIEPEHIEPGPSELDRSELDLPELDLPELDRTDDPRGGAVVWALLAVAVSLVACCVCRRTVGRRRLVGHQLSPRRHMSRPAAAHSRR